MNVRHRVTTETAPRLRIFRGPYGPCVSGFDFALRPLQVAESTDSAERKRDHKVQLSCWSGHLDT